MTENEIFKHFELLNYYLDNELETDLAFERCKPFYSVELLENGERVGAATVSDYNGKAVLDYVAVSPNLRARGIGGKLVDLVHLRAKKLGYTEVFLVAKAPLFFQKVGYLPSDDSLNLLAECGECDQFLKKCFPKTLKFELE